MSRSRNLLHVAALGSALMLPVAAAAQDAAASSERLFRARCGSCHSLQAGENGAGPHLAALIGRRAGTVEGARFSSALKASGLVWDERTLDAYLANPRRTVPGTTMLVTLPSAAERASVIQYLAGASTVSAR